MKSRVSYPKEVRAAAKAAGHGLLTVSLKMANGELLEEQTDVGMLDTKFAKWAMVLLFCEEVRDKPDMEKVVRELME